MKRALGPFCLVLVLFNSVTWLNAQESETIHVSVALVQLNVAVTDNKGNYVTGLKPSDFVVTEDNLPEKIAIFGEGNQGTHRLVENGQSDVAHTLARPGQSEPGGQVTLPAENSSPSIASGANVFILFDTSNYMYSGFVFAQDAISGFIRSLESPSKVAFYSYSRNLLRAAPLTADKSQAVNAVRNIVAGDDAALYNALLLTVQDASRYTGRKMVVVFSNGPDNASTVPPEDVAELAQSAGIPIYIISTREARLEPVSAAVFDRMTAATGGKAYFAKNWRDEHLAFASIQDDLAHLYSISYYPAANPNRGWRTISVKLVGDALKKYHIRTRNGYRPKTTALASSHTEEPSSNSAPD